MELQAALRILALSRAEDLVNALNSIKSLASQINLDLTSSSAEESLGRRNPFEASKFKYQGWNPSGYPVTYNDPEEQFDFSNEEDCREYASGFATPLTTRFSPFKAKFSKFYSFGPEEERGPCGIWRLGKKPVVEILVYYATELNKDPNLLKSYYVAIKASHQILEKAGVSACLNGISFGILPKLQHTEASGITKDAFGVYARFGRFEWLEFASSIKEVVLLEFNQAIIEKLKKVKEDLKLSEVELLYKVITILHELGHRVDYACMEPEQHRIFEFWAKWKKVFPVSKYAATSPKEWFAECFAAWVLSGLKELENLGKGEIVKEFENILALVPSETNLDPTGILSSIKSMLKAKTLVKNQLFTMLVSYKKGPPQKITGSWLGVQNDPLPTVIYKDETGRSRKFNFFANREVSSIEFSDSQEA